MSDVSMFLKKNKIAKENAFYAATKSLTDDKGDPLLWEIRPITPKENDLLLDECTTYVPVPGKRGQTRPKLKNNEYMGKLVAASVVTPDLMNAELQDSYGARKPEDLLKALVDDLGEYNALMAFVNDFNGFDAPLQDEVEEAKN